MIKDITQMQSGEKGVVKKIEGGFGFMSKIQNIGIRPGKEIVKLSSQFMHGPQIVEIDKMRVAIGFGMARKIFIEMEEK